jgi:hypothetical protein
MRKPKLSPIEEFEALSDDEKERVYCSVDRVFSRKEGHPLTREQRKAWAKFQERRGKRGRPKVGQGAKTVSLTIEGALLKRADALAKREGMSRAQIVARGLELLLKAS